MSRRQLAIHGKAVLLVAIGGVLGTQLRHAFGAAAGGALLTTVLVNAAGSFGLGLLLFTARGTHRVSTRARLVIGTGFFASFTTYSTFIADVAGTSPTLGVVYILGSYAMGFAGIVASRTFVRTVSGEMAGPPRGDP